MPFTVLTPTVILPAAAGAVVYGAVDSVNGNMFANNGKCELRVKNASGGAVTVTVSSVPDPYGRTGDIVQVIAAGAEYEFGLLDPALFNQRSGDVGYVHVTFSASASITAVVVQLG